MKRTFRSATISLLSAITCLAMAACIDPGAGDDGEDPLDSDDGDDIESPLDSDEAEDEADLGEAEPDLGMIIENASDAEDATVSTSSTRIAYWWGKVNAHVDAGGNWVKDADCTSGANLDPLTYCRKFYPATTSAIAVALSTKPALLWNTAGCGAQYTSNGQNEWFCKQPTPRIAYWWGKVNAHVDAGGNWVKDADCTSGANLDPLTYCKKFYPATSSVTAVALSTKPALLWNTAGCGAQYTSNGQNEWTCNQPPPRIAYWPGKVNAHRDSGGNWVKDADCTSGANLDPLTYCQKFYPATTSVTAVAVTSKPALLWNTAGCGAQYTSNGHSEWTCNP